MKTFFAFLLIGGMAFAGDPAKDLFGSIEAYKNSDSIKVAYDVNEKRAVSLECNRLGFKVKEDYEKGSYYICEFNQNTSLRKIIELTSFESVKSVSPNPKAKVIP
jgi:hypothetical protein